MEAVLDIRNIETYYGNIMAIKGLSLRVQEGQIVTILGANGAGKTTIMRVISGVIVDQPEKGVIEFFGKPIERMKPAKIARLGISHVPQGREIFPELTVTENLVLGSYNRKNKEEIKKDLEIVTEYFPFLKSRKKQRADTLSGGEQQMVAIARGLMSKPKLMLLDEPSLGLSPILVKEIFGIIRDINKAGTTILMAEQNARMALSVAQHGYVLENGRIVLFDKAYSLMQDEDVAEFYLGAKEYTKVKSYKRKKKWS